MNKRIVFLCGARDFHAMDWYRSAEKQLPKENLCILTDLIAGEGFKKIISDKDNVYNLIIIDKLLFKGQSLIGNFWRNLIKLIVFPFQVLLLRKFNAKYPNSIYYAHSMYYLWLAAAANLKFIGTPQGSDILIKPFKSRIYKFLSVWSLKSAKYVTVDSKKMKDKILEISNVNANIIQNGIDISSMNKILSSFLEKQITRNKILSIRGLSPLYRIEEILYVRNEQNCVKDFPISFIYPFYENQYKNKLLNYLSKYDEDLGRVNRNQMYKLLIQSKLVISIPKSDSSPRSVYESIFCGSAVAITYHPFYDILPICMKKRIILIKLDDKNWFINAIKEAESIINSKFIPSEEALDLFDQDRSFNKVLDLIKICK